MQCLRGVYQGISHKPSKGLNVYVPRKMQVTHALEIQWPTATNGVVHVYVQHMGKVGCNAIEYIHWPSCILIGCVSMA